MGSFMDKIYNMMGVDVGDTYEEEYYDDYGDEAYDEPPRSEYMPSRRTSSRSSRVSRFEDAPQMRLVIMQPQNFEESRDIANHLKERKPIVVNLEYVEKTVSRRIVDFLSGAVYALDGDIRKVANHIFLITPCNVGVEEDADDGYGYDR